jgi:hypothetical protein
MKLSHDDELEHGPLHLLIIAKKTNMEHSSADIIKIHRVKAQSTSTRVVVQHTIHSYYRERKEKKWRSFKI